MSTQGVFVRREFNMERPQTKGHFLQPDWRAGSNLHRFEAVHPYVTGRSVLDLGGATNHSRADWIVGRIAEVATEVVSVDLDEEKVAGMAADAAVKVVIGNAETIRLGRTFDVVHAGEIIEHLDNAGLFLATVREHLAPGGVLLLTTPNAFAVSNFAYRVGGSPRVNQDHTCWYCEDTLRQLLDRHGFCADISYLQHKSPAPLRALLARAVRQPLSDRLSWNTLFAVARLREPVQPPS